jgi:hypothetical protein
MSKIFILVWAGLCNKEQINMIIFLKLYLIAK